MNIAKENLLAVLRKCLPGVEKGGSLIEGADTVVFAGNFAHTFNDRIAVTAPVEGQEGGQLSGAVKALDLFKLVSKMPALVLSVEVGPEAWQFSAGRSKGKLTLLKSVAAERISAMGLDGVEWEPLPGNFAQGVNLCTLKTNSPFRGIFTDGSEMLSTDNMRMCLFGMDKPMPQMWIDTLALSEMFKLPGEATHFNAGATGEWAHFKMSDGTIFSARREPADQFPAGSVKQTIAMVCSSTTPSISGTLPDGISGVVDRVATMAASASGQSHIRLRLTREDLEVFAEKTSCSMTESVPWAAPLERDPNVELWVECSFLVEAAGKAMDFRVTPPSDGVPGTLIFSGTNYTQVAATADRE